MKEYINRACIAAAMLIPFCLASCAGIFDDTLEISGDLSQQRYNGDSYERVSATQSDVGFNVAYWWLMGLAKNEGGSSFLQQTGKYQLAYAPPSYGPSAWGRGSYRYRPMLSPQSSGSEFLDHLKIMTGLEFVQKNSSDGGAKVRLNYLEVPVLAIYHYDLSNDRRIFGGLGPYLAYGLGGKIKGDGFKEKAFDKDFGFKRFDFGLTFTAGYKFNKKWSARLAYDLGLINIERESVDKAHNRSFAISVGYSPQLIQKLFKK